MHRPATFDVRPLVSGIVTAAGLLSATAAEGNLRAPQRDYRGPSFAISGAADGLVVSGETLKFTCALRRCQVEARYDIEATAAADFELRFITPSTDHIVASVNGHEAPVTKAVVPDTTQRHREENTLLYEASFPATLVRGGNGVVVTYEQPLGLYESSYGYFQPSEFVYTLPYELGPLTEWKRSAKFAIDLSIHYATPDRGLFSRLFGGPKITCPNLTATTFVDEGDYVEARFRISGATIPDKLACGIDADDPDAPGVSQSAAINRVRE